jgi:hypothetical protein
MGDDRNKSGASWMDFRAMSRGRRSAGEELGGRPVQGGAGRGVLFQKEVIQ